MYKHLLSATAIALAFGLQGCGMLPTTPKVDASGSFAHADKPGARGIVAEKVGLADAALAAGDSASAIRMYRDLAREYPLSIEPRIRLGAALLGANAPQEAARVYEGANKINPTYDGLTGLGRVYLALRQPADALKEFDRAAQMRPGDAAAMNGQGVALDQLGRHAEAQKIYLAVLDKDPSDIKVRSNYALSLAFAGKFDDAADILNSLAQVPGSDNRIRQNLALVYGLAGNPGQAAHFGRMDLDEDAVNSNLKYYGAVRALNAPAEKTPDLTRPSAAGPVPSEIGPFDAVQAKPLAEPVASKQTAPEFKASAAPAKTIEVPKIAARAIKPRDTRAAPKPVLGEAGIKPVIFAHIEPAKSSSPAEAKPPSDAELAEILAPAKAEAGTTKKQARAASQEHRNSLTSLPMTRAEAAAQQPGEAAPAITDDVVPIHKQPASKDADRQVVKAAAESAKSVEIASSALLKDDLKPVPVTNTAGSHAPAVPPMVAPSGVTASLEPRAAVPAVSAAPKLSKAAKKLREAKHGSVSAAAMTLDANSVDTGVRPPAVPAML